MVRTTAAAPPEPAPAGPQLGITPRPPFSWRQTLAALRGFEAVPDRGRVALGAPEAWELALRVGSGAGRLVVRVRLAPSGGASASDLRLTFDHGDALTLEQAADAWTELGSFLALHLDLAPLVAAAADDPAFAPVERALHGFHPPRFRNAFQAACWCVVRQRTPQRFAVATMRRLTELLGEAVVVEGAEPLPLFPAPEALAHGAREPLLQATNNLRKVERLEGVARAFVGVDEAELRRAGYDEVHRWLGSLPGLGPWSAEQVLWRGLGRVERAPWKDTGALAAVSAVYTPGLTLVPGAARELARYYGELQGVWLAYLKAYPRVAGAAGRGRAAARPG